MRALILGLALTVVASSASAQRAERVALDKSAAMPAVPLAFASTSLRLTPADATAPWTPPAPAPMMAVNGGRVAGILIGAVIGAGVVYGSMASLNCKDCSDDSAMYGAIGGAIVGGVIGNMVWSYRQRRATTPPAPR
jgi:hypothetical protein